MAVAQDGIAVPLLFEYLDHKGNSDSELRKILIDKFINLFGIERIACILGDREFVGEDWFLYLSAKRLPFVMRIKCNQLLRHSNGGQMRADKMIVCGETKATKLSKITVNITRKKLEGDTLLLASSFDIKDPISEYAKRWDI